MISDVILLGRARKSECVLPLEPLSRPSPYVSLPYPTVPHLTSLHLAFLTWFTQPLATLPPIYLPQHFLEIQQGAQIDIG